MASKKGSSSAVADSAPLLHPTSNLFADLLLSARPKQWTKNLILYLALIFSINQSWSLTDVPKASQFILESTLAFLLFCALSSGIYFINDVIDIENDRRHPQKRFRPLPSGRISPAQALLAAVLLVGTSLAGGYLLNQYFAAIEIGYIVLMLAYSAWLKHIVIIDVFSIAAGFVLRAVAGAVVIAVPISPWLYICTVLGALFLGFSKRRHELILLEENAANHRPILNDYTPELLEQMIAVVTPTTVVAYSLYTFTAEGLPQNHAMMLTIPFVLYGIFRYLYLIHLKNAGGSPEEILLRDRPLLIDILLWIITAAAVLLIFR